MSCQTAFVGGPMLPWIHSNTSGSCCHE